MTQYIQSFITNISFDSTMVQLEQHSKGLTGTLIDFLFDDCQEGKTEWTSPKWAKAGDVVFFMHSKKSIE